MNNIPYIDILILAMIAIFIINRLRNVLGKKTGNESDIVEKFTQRKSAFKESEPDSISDEKVTKLDHKIKKTFHSNKKINSVINEIIKIDNNFEINSFFEGAKKAFEFILTEYSNNNLKVLEKLVNKNIYKEFENQINLRTDKNEELEITVISVKTPEIKSVNLEKKYTAYFKLLFSSEQVQITKNSKGDIIDGDSNQILQIKEIWTFSKNLKSKDPNWILEEIEEN
tara:strand:+ start:125 stop:805 length:681 start_codon:yes stop_codon:yes gene_type:complete